MTSKSQGAGSTPPIESNGAARIIFRDTARLHETVTWRGGGEVSNSRQRAEWWDEEASGGGDGGGGMLRAGRNKGVLQEHTVLFV